MKGCVCVEGAGGRGGEAEKERKRPVVREHPQGTVRRTLGVQSGTHPYLLLAAAAPHRGLAGPSSRTAGHDRAEQDTVQDSYSGNL